MWHFPVRSHQGAGWGGEAQRTGKVPLQEWPPPHGSPNSAVGNYSRLRHHGWEILREHSKLDEEHQRGGYEMVLGVCEDLRRGQAWGETLCSQWRPPKHTFSPIEFPPPHPILFSIHPWFRSGMTRKGKRWPTLPSGGKNLEQALNGGELKGRSQRQGRLPSSGYMGTVMVFSRFLWFVIRAFYFFLNDFACFILGYLPSFGASLLTSHP